MHLDRRTALLVVPIEVLGSVDLLGNDFKQVGIGGLGKGLGDLCGHMFIAGREIGHQCGPGVGSRGIIGLGLFLFTCAAGSQHESAGYCN